MMMADDDRVDTVARTLRNDAIEIDLLDQNNALAPPPRQVAASAEPVLLTLNEHADPATDVAASPLTWYVLP
jgi:hypothetical protein